MEPNPYAAPAATLDLPSAVATPEESWTLGDAAGIAWQMVKDHWLLLFARSMGVSLVKEGLTQLVSLGLPTDPALAAELQKHLAAAHWSEVGRIIARALTLGTTSLVLTSFLHAGPEAVLVRIYQAALRGEPFRMSSPLAGLRRTAACGVTATIVAVLMTVGVASCFLPGLFVVITLGWAQYFTAEAELGPIASLKESWRIAVGRLRWRLGLLILIAFGLSGAATTIGLPARIAVSLAADLFANVAFALATGRIVAPGRQGEVMAPARDRVSARGVTSLSSGDRTYCQTSGTAVSPARLTEPATAASASH